MLAHALASQAAKHAVYGGVVPELASREHAVALRPLLTQALKEAGVTLQEIDLIAVARGPGLMGPLLVGLQFAKGLAMGLQKPLIGVNHVEAHLFASHLEHSHIPLPAVGLIASGGHTALVRVGEEGLSLIGQTIDDAVGEAFDKVGTALGLTYPAGPLVEKLAREGRPCLPLPKGQIKERPLDFSFSGLKTAAARLIQKGENRADIAASFQETALDDLVTKLLIAAQQEGAQSLLFGGGVICNQRLREKIAAATSLPLFFPSPDLCRDNAAMIAALGLAQYQKRGPSSLDLPPLARIAFDKQSSAS